jgi:hypothetical protein
VLYEVRTAASYGICVKSSLQRVTRLQIVGGKKMCVCVCIFGGRNLSLMMETADLTLHIAVDHRGHT